VRGLLDEIGLDGRRVQMVNMSSAMGAHFAMAATEMTEQVRELGPSPARSLSRLTQTEG
jgi:F420-non-reducing hydrogenase iron-sulfur subunit